MKKIDELEKEIWDQIEVATKKRDSVRIAVLTAIDQDIKKVKNEIARIEQVIEESKGPAPQDSGKSVVFEITQGAIRQNYLTLKEIRRNNLIPTDGKEFSVETSVGLSFMTNISKNGNWLAARGKTSEFFKKAGVKAGDKVIWREIAPYRYHLSKR